MLPKIEIKRKRSVEEYKISNHVFEVIEKLRLKNPNVDEKIKKIYTDAVGNEVAAITSFIKYKDNTLTVKIKDPVWKTDLSFREEEIKKLINLSKNNYLLVEKIIFK